MWHAVDMETSLRRCIALDHPRWTWDQVMAALREAMLGRGEYAVLAAEWLAANEG